MAIDEPLDKYIEQLEKETEFRPGLEAVRFVLRLLLGSAGAILDALDSLLGGLAQKRFRERLIEVLYEFAKRIKQLDSKEALNQDFFRTEEFQTLFFSAAQQLFTTHQRPKLQMLGTALANSGSKEYSKDSRKQTFFHILASLDLVHLELLKRLGAGGLVRGIGDSVKGEEFLSAQFLVSLGLAEEYREFIPIYTPPGKPIRIDQVLDHLKRDQFIHCTRISTLGKDFLEFMGEKPEVGESIVQPADRPIP